MGTSGLGNRDDALQQLRSRRFDLAIVGGGITGAGVALDAATRGLKVALIDKGDFASGTSGRSSKLVHGGLRYLENREFGLVREAAHERDRLRRIAPHLVTPVPFFWPRWAGARREAGVGLWIYHALAGMRSFRRHHKISPEEARRLAPRTRKSAGGYLYYDAQTDDTRLVLAVLAAAVRAGAVVCNYTSCDAFLDAGGRVMGLAARDVPTAEEFDVRANEVVNAAGVWADEVQWFENRGGAAELRPSKGIHITLPASALRLNAALLFPTPDRKLIFAVPWRSVVLVGTTDTEYAGDLETPSVEADEVDYMLASLSNAFDREFSRRDVVSAFAGLRPLLAHGDTERTRDLSRRHRIFIGPKGVITVTGGKLTTYRTMAEEVVDIVASRRGAHVRSITSTVRLGVSDLRALEASVAGRARELRLPEEVQKSLISRHGDGAIQVLDLARDEQLIEPFADGLPYLTAELAWGVRSEMACTVEDLLDRRTRVSIEDRHGGLQREDEITRITGSALAISATEAATQVSSYKATVALERGPALSASRA